MANEFSSLFQNRGEHGRKIGFPYTVSTDFNNTDYKIAFEFEAAPEQRQRQQGQGASEPSLVTVTTELGGISPFVYIRDIDGERKGAIWSITSKVNDCSLAKTYSAGILGIVSTSESMIRRESYVLVLWTHHV